MIAFVKLDNYWASYLPYCFLHMGYHLKKNNIKYKIFHNSYANKFNEERKRFLDEIIELKPDIVALSVITGRQTKDSAEFCIELKKRMSKIKILWGGIHPTVLSKQCISQPYIDYVLQGEADTSICDFYNALMNGGNFENVPGCWWKEDGEILSSKLPFTKEDPKRISLDFSCIDIEKYFSGEKSLSLITSRGCPFSCQFCVIQSLDLRRWRPFPMDIVKETIDMFKLKGIKHLHINDDNFYVNFDRAISILEYAQLPSFSEIRIPTLLKDNRLKILSELNCSKLMSGAESCDNDILKKIKKGQTFEQMLEAASLFGNCKNVEPSWSFIIGMPVETMDNMMKTIKGKERLDKLVGGYIGPLGIYMPYPGSPLYDMAVEKGFKKPENPIEWACFERYGLEGRLTPPEHEAFPWMDIKKVWYLASSVRKKDDAKKKRSFFRSVKSIVGRLWSFKRKERY